MLVRDRQEMTYGQEPTLGLELISTNTDHFMPQTDRKFRFWIVFSVVWFLLATVLAAYLAYRSMGEVNTFLVILHMPLTIGWGLWWKVPGLLKRVDSLFTAPKGEDVSKERLRRMLADGLLLLNRPVNTELEFNRWKTDEKNWGSAVYRELKTGFNESLAESFQSLDDVREFEIASSFNNEHNSRKLFLNKKLNNLIKIIK